MLVDYLDTLSSSESDLVSAFPSSSVVLTEAPGCSVWLGIAFTAFATAGRLLARTTTKELSEKTFSALN